MTVAIVVGACALAWASSRRLRVEPVAPAVSGTLDVPRAIASSDAPAPVQEMAKATVATLHVPRVHGPFPINAETEGKTTWEGEAGDTGNLIDELGRGMVPYTEAKARWGDGQLYFLLYAGDLDLEGSVRTHDGVLDGDDSFRLEFRTGDSIRVIQVSVLGTIADALCKGPPLSRRCDAAWESRARVAVDRDGTLNKLGDNDEEWVVEMAIPLSALGFAHPKPGLTIPFSVRRCEVGSGARACGTWGAGEKGGELVLDP